MSKIERAIDTLRNAFWRFAEGDGSEEEREYNDAKAYLLRCGFTAEEVRALEPEC